MTDAMEEETDSEDDAPGPKAAALGPPQPATGEAPNPVLFVQGLPAEVTSDMLSPLFQQYVTPSPPPQLGPCA